MKSSRITLVIVFFTSLVFAQSKDSVTLISGDVLFGKIQVIKNTLGTDYILMDDTLAIPFERINNFQTDKGYFAIISGRAAKRIFKGKLDLFYEAKQRFVYDLDSSLFDYGFMNRKIIRRVIDNSVLYISKSGSPIKEANYENLVKILSDNYESMKILDDYNNMTYAKYGIAVIGVGVILYYLRDLGNNNFGEVKKPNFGVLAAGGLAIGISYGIHLFQEPLLKKRTFAKKGC